MMIISSESFEGRYFFAQKCVKRVFGRICSVERKLVIFRKIIGNKMSFFRKNDILTSLYIMR